MTPLDDDQVRATINALTHEEAAIADEYQRLEIRLSQIRAAKAALINLQNEEPVEFDGKLADACRVVLKNLGNRSLTPTEVRDAVRLLGYPISNHANQMAAVHSVLKRLVESGEVKPKEWSQMPGQKRYIWAANVDLPPASAQILKADAATMVLSGKVPGVIVRAKKEEK